MISEVMKNDNCIRILTALFNKCLETQLLPSTWLQAMIAPVPKNASSDPRVPLNYHGISLLPVISKMFSALVGSRVGGFRPNRSGMDHIFTLCDLLRIRKHQNQETFCAFIDFLKAFNCVNHEFLMYKLAINDIVGRMLGIIRSMYSEPLSCVNVAARLTDWFQVGAGVCQGDSLSPTLFALSMNDLAHDIKEAQQGVYI